MEMKGQPWDFLDRSQNPSSIDTEGWLYIIHKFHKAILKLSLIKGNAFQHNWVWDSLFHILNTGHSPLK